MNNLKKRFCCKVALLALIVVNYFLLFMRFVWWLLDNQYGMGERLRFYRMEPFSKFNEVLNQIYSEIYFDLYFFAGVTLVMCVLFWAILRTYDNQNEENRSVK